MDRSRRGIVVIERDDRPIAAGFVLANDGRIVTSLSAVGEGDDLDARFADGNIVRVRLAHRDATWDLALLVPEAGRWPDGLLASEMDPEHPEGSLAAFAPERERTRSFTLKLKGKKRLLSPDATGTTDGIDVGTSPEAAKAIGSPIVDAKSSVLALVTRACVPAEHGPCKPGPFGVPVDVLRDFLMHAPADAVAPAAWLGVEVAPDAEGFARGVRVRVVRGGSPADEAHLRGGARDQADLIVAVDGVPMTTPDALSAAIAEHAVGDRIVLLVLRKGRFVETPAILRRSPQKP
jgi:serine protease Do